VRHSGNEREHRAHLRASRAAITCLKGGECTRCRYPGRAQAGRQPALDAEDRPGIDGPRPTR